MPCQAAQSTELRLLLQNGGPYLSGKEPCSQCLALAPRIYHISIATARIKVHSGIVVNIDRSSCLLSEAAKRYCAGSATQVRPAIVAVLASCGLEYGIL